MEFYCRWLVLHEKTRRKPCCLFLQATVLVTAITRQFPTRGFSCLLICHLAERGQARRWHGASRAGWVPAAPASRPHGIDPSCPNPSTLPAPRVR